MNTVQPNVVKLSDVVKVDLEPQAFVNLRTLEGFLLEDVVRERIRQQSCNSKRFWLPHVDFKDYTLMMTYEGEWFDFNDVEIDYVARILNTDTGSEAMVYGSVKRSEKFQRHDNLAEHVDRLHKQQPHRPYPTKLPEDYFLVAISCDRMDPVSKTTSLSHDHPLYHFGLNDLY